MRRFVLGVLGFAVVVLVGCVLCGLVPPRLRIKCYRDEAGRLLVDLKPNFRINGIFTAELWIPGDDRYLWAVAEGDAELRRMVYGEVPAGAKQEYPRGGAPPRDIPAGSVFCVSVHYQYDTAIPPAACGGNESAKFQILKDGTIEYLGRPTSEDKLPYPVPGGRLLHGDLYGGPDWVDPEAEPLLAPMIEQLIEQNPAVVQDYLGGEEAFDTLGYRLERLDSDIYGADPELARRMLRARLDVMKPEGPRIGDQERAQDQ